jgi:cell cycle sensor histidine kinase DivJ
MALTKPLHEVDLTVPRATSGRFAVVWHLVWIPVLGLAALGLSGAGAVLWALASMAAAALVGALAVALQPPGRVVAVCGWGLAGAVAVALGGGPSGPLAAWCLAPMAAAAVFQDRRTLALGAAAGLAAAAISALITALTPPPPPFAPWLGLLALSTTAVGLAAGLLAYQGGAERARRRVESTEAAMAFLAAQPITVATLDAEGCILRAAGRGAEGLTGRALIELVTEADRPALISALAEGGRLRARGSEDPEAWIDITLTTTADGAVHALMRDADEDHAREAALIAERDAADQANAGKSRFLAGMSHELRTPLNAIMGFSDIMRQRLFGPLGDRYAEYAGLIHESGEHLLELINDLLDMSKIEAERYELAREDFDAREAATAVLRLMRGQADRAGVMLRGVLPSAPLMVSADRRALKQIPLNLLANALRFTPAGGAVTLTLAAVEGELELAVVDTGVGIAPADLERLGRPYEQAGDADKRAGGTGLGLSLVRAFAALHGGRFTIESVEGEGAAARVRLPVLLPEAQRAPGS